MYAARHTTATSDRILGQLIRRLSASFGGICQKYTDDSVNLGWCVAHRRRQSHNHWWLSAVLEKKFARFSKLALSLQYLFETTRGDENPLVRPAKDLSKIPPSNGSRPQIFLSSTSSPKEKHLGGNPGGYSFFGWRSDASGQAESGRKIARTGLASNPANFSGKAISS